MKKTIIDALIRAVRTFVQSALGVYLAGLVAVPALADLGTWPLISAALAAGIVATLWNVLETIKTVPYNRG